MTQVLLRVRDRSRHLQAEPMIDRTGTVWLEGQTWHRSVEWLDESCLGSPAFWIAQARRQPLVSSMRMGRTLVEEVALCMLGGYGVNESMSTQAFWTVRDAGLLDVRRPPTVADIESVLRTAMTVPGYTRPVHYRFPAQRAKRVAKAVETLAGWSLVDEALPPRVLRDRLTTLDGVGLKTASWVVRNMTQSDDIAIVDIHIRRAGVAAGVFDPMWVLPRDYLVFEEAFCAWAQQGGVATASLDLCIWSTLSSLGAAARALFGVERLSDMDIPLRRE